MKKLIPPFLIATAMLSQSFDISAQKKKFNISIETPDDVDIVVLQNGKPLTPNTPKVPEYVIKEGDNKFIMSIGGYLKPIVGWDIGNTLSDILFIPAQIPVPAERGRKTDFFSNPLHSALDFQFIALPGQRDQLTAYMKIMWNAPNAGVQLHNVYVQYRGFLLGRNTTMFADGGSMPYTIDPQGPNGAISVHSYQTSYTSKSYKGFSFALSVELPTFDKYPGAYHGHDYPDLNNVQFYEEATQPVPDIPAYIQYQGKGMNRIRLSGIFRYFFYRNKVQNVTRGVVGWGAQISGNIQPVEPLLFYYQAAYGKGIANYIQDINGLQISYIPKDNEPGKMEAAGMMGWLAGFKYTFNSKINANLMFSQARVWNAGQYYPDYRYGLYACGNVFYNIKPYLICGAEYLWGKHSTYFSGHATDSRIQTTLMFLF